MSTMKETLLKRIVTTAHTNVDYALVQKHAKMVFDTKNAMKKVPGRDNIEVL